MLSLFIPVWVPTILYNRLALRGVVTNRTYDINLEPKYFPSSFFEQYFVLFTVVLRNSRVGLRQSWQFALEVWYPYRMLRLRCTSLFLRWYLEDIYTSRPKPISAKKTKKSATRWKLIIILQKTHHGISTSSDQGSSSLRNKFSQKKVLTSS